MESKNYKIFEEKEDIAKVYEKLLLAILQEMERFKRSESTIALASLIITSNVRFINFVCESKLAIKIVEDAIKLANEIARGNVD